MTTISMTRLAETVQKMRKALGLTQQDVQERTGINRQLIGRIEKGEFLPSRRSTSRPTPSSVRPSRPTAS